MKIQVQAEQGDPKGAEDFAKFMQGILNLLLTGSVTLDQANGFLESFREPAPNNSQLELCYEPIGDDEPVLT